MSLFTCGPRPGDSLWLFTKPARTLIRFSRISSLQRSSPGHRPHQRAVPIDRDFVRRVRVHIYNTSSACHELITLVYARLTINVTHHWLAALQNIIRRRITSILIRTSRHRTRRCLWHTRIQLMRIQTRVDVLCELRAVAADVDVGEGIAAEDVVEGFEGGGAVAGVVG